MFRRLVGAVAVMTCCLTVALTEAAPRKGGGGGGRSGGGQAQGAGGGRAQGAGGGAARGAGPGAAGGRSAAGRGDSGPGAGQKSGMGGAWSDFNGGGAGHAGGQFGGLHGASGVQGIAEAHAGGNLRGSQTSGTHDAAAGAAFNNRNSSQATGAEGAAFANRNEPEHSGAQGAAAGAGIANRNDPQYSGTQGAVAGAAAENRNAPQYSGAQGAAAGAGIANRNEPQYSGAQGAAAGAAIDNRNSPQYSGAQGVATGAAAANRSAPEFSGAQGAAAASLAGGGSPNYAAVRGNFTHPNVYGQSWYSVHPNAWAATGWAAGAAWTPTAWTTIAVANRYNNASTVSYNYGSNVTCIDNNVVVDGQQVGTAEEFGQQASDLAESGATAELADSDQWMPLGVFAMVRNEQQHPQLIMQLAINQNGILRGNYTDEVTDTSQPIQGDVDPQTKRAAWTVGENKFCVMEAGLSNLTQNELPALIHKNGTTQRWLLVRLEQPNSNETSVAH
jgi:hypothetical protein